MSFDPGTVIAQRYRLVQKLGAGGMGAVYRACDVDDPRAVYAMKILDARIDLQDVQKEFRATLALEHKNIRRVHALDVDADRRINFIVMEMLDGMDLEQYVEQKGPLPLALGFKEAMGQIADALDHAHARRIVHRDLKPENVFLSVFNDQWSVKLLDFGIAKLLDEGATNSRIIGTPTCMAPEQLGMGDKRVSPATDVWAFGLIGFYAATGRHYWIQANAANVEPGPVLAEVLAPHSHAKASARAAVLGSPVTLPPKFDAWFARCIAFDASARFPTIREAADALQVALRKKITKTGGPVAVQTAQPPPVQPPPKVLLQVPAPAADTTKPPRTVARDVDPIFEAEQRLIQTAGEALRQRIPGALAAMDVKPTAPLVAPTDPGPPPVSPPAGGGTLKLPDPSSPPTKGVATPMGGTLPALPMNRPKISLAAFLGILFALTVLTAIVVMKLGSSDELGAASAKPAPAAAKPPITLVSRPAAQGDERSIREDLKKGGDRQELTRTEVCLTADKLGCTSMTVTYTKARLVEAAGDERVTVNSGREYAYAVTSSGYVLKSEPTDAELDQLNRHYASRPFYAAVSELPSTLSIGDAVDAFAHALSSAALEERADGFSAKGVVTHEGFVGTDAVVTIEVTAIRRGSGDPVTWKGSVDVRKNPREILKVTLVSDAAAAHYPLTVLEYRATVSTSLARR